jgi:hypothetical protein
MLRQFIYSEPKNSGTEVPVVKGTCPVCSEEVTDKDKRYKHNGQYYHNKCYKTLKTPFVCEFCGGATTYSDIAKMEEMKDVNKTMKGNEKIVGYYHFKCLIARDRGEEEEAAEEEASSSEEEEEEEEEK